MNLAQMIREEIKAYVEGRRALSELRTWLGDHAQDIFDSDDADVNRLDGQAWILISELDYGHRDEVSVQTALAAAIDGVQQAVVTQSAYLVQTVTASADRPEPAITVYAPLMPAFRTYDPAKISAGRGAHNA